MAVPSNQTLHRCIAIYTCQMSDARFPILFEERKKWTPILVLVYKVMHRIAILFTPPSLHSGPFFITIRPECVLKVMKICKWQMILESIFNWIGHFTTLWNMVKPKDLLIQVTFSEKGTKMTPQLHIYKSKILSLSNKIHKNSDFLPLLWRYILFWT